MPANRPTLREVRRAAGPLLLGVFLVAGWAGPLAHVAGHRDDHHHRAAAGVDHDAAHRLGVPHHHPLPSAPRDTESPGPAPRHAPAPEHGANTVEHFGLALVAAPSAPAVLPPAGDVVPLPDEPRRASLSPALPPPPARGPPLAG